MQSLSHWLENKNRPNAQFQKLTINYLDEKCEYSIMMPYLKELFVKNIVNPSLHDAVAQRYGKSKAAQALISPKIPVRSRMRKGRFGEVLTSSILVEFYDYEIPVQKMQFLITSDESQPSTDTIAIKNRNGTVIEVCYLESKLRTTNISTMGREALVQLKNDLAKKIPDMLLFVVTQLYERNDPLYYELLKFMMERIPSVLESFRIGLVSEKGKWSDTCLANLDTAITDKESRRVDVDVIRISCLDQLVRELFNSFKIEVDLEDE